MEIILVVTYPDYNHANIQKRPGMSAGEALAETTAIHLNITHGLKCHVTTNTTNRVNMASPQEIVRKIARS